MDGMARRWLVGLVAGLLGTYGGCGRQEPASSTESPAAKASAAASQPAEPVPPAEFTSATVTRPPAPAVDPVVIFQTSAGEIHVRLFAEKAPQTVDNFLRNYVQRGFYDQTIFHHVEPGAMLLAGGYTADLEAKPTRAPIYNESRNGLSNRRGTLAMICDPQAPHSATSQFFINLRDNPDLDFRSEEGEDILGYCVFGEVIAGMDVVDQIAARPTESRGEFPRIPSPPVAILGVRQIR
jgi:peptidyl-prolyl cis-trans isomerase A (cyclophilin A)/peptidyl-prolyl cis-trans isomerase B (cyclophilin B)